MVELPVSRDSSSLTVVVLSLFLQLAPLIAGSSTVMSRTSRSVLLKHMFGISI